MQAGDKVYLFQYQSGGSAGFDICFTDGVYAASTTGFHDQNGYYSQQDQLSGSWHQRVFAMDAYAGKHINGFDFIMDSQSPVGSWDVEFRSFVYVAADGSTFPIYTGESSFAVTPWSYMMGVSARSFTVSRFAGTGEAAAPVFTTAYYHEDHLGTSRLITGGEGWPIWQGTFLPFGQEWNPQITTNHYKFTGHERDAESNLDMEGARYYSPTMGRFMTPDWSATPEAVPYADLNDPQTLNLYGYVRNNPMSKADPDGHCRVPRPCFLLFVDETAKRVLYKAMSRGNTFPDRY